jgi:hypothetical protein
LEQRGKRPRPNEEGPSGRGERTDKERPEWQTRVHRVKNDEKSPLIPSQVTPDDIDISVRVQLKTLTAENAEMVARHLAMVSLLIDDDPALAHKHALAASRRAGRLAIVHETLGLTAYASGEFALAIRELLTHRRLSGSNDQLPLIVDSERGLGRPERALEAVVGIDRSELDTGVRINLAIVLSGARLDLGQAKLAVQELEIPELNPKRIFQQSPLLFRSYAECLREAGSDGDKWDELALRAEKAMAEQGEELFQVFEEISIPTSEDFERTMKPANSFSNSDRKFTPGDRKFTPREGGAARSDRASRPDRTDRPDRSDRPSRPSSDRSERTDRPSRPDRTDRPDRSSSSSRTERPDRSSSSSRTDRPDRSDRPSRPDSGRPSRPYSDRPERTDRPSRPDRTDRPDRSSSSSRTDRPDRSDRPSRPDSGRPSRPSSDRSERTDRPSRPYSDRPERTDRPSRPDSGRPSRPSSDRSERTDRPSRPSSDRSERTDRPSRPDRTDRPDRSSSSSRTERPDRSDRPSRPDSGRPSRPDSKRPDFKRSNNKGKGPRGAGK